MNQPTAWELMMLTIRSLPCEFWRVSVTIIGACYSLGNDTQTFFLKSRAVFYGTIFGYLFADAVANGFDLNGKWQYALFAGSGIGGTFVAGIVLDAFRLASANWRNAIPIVWDEIKKSIPLHDILTRILNRKQ